MDIDNSKEKKNEPVQKVIDKTAQKLQQKYSKTRKINEHLLQCRHKWLKILSQVLSGVCAIFVFLVALLSIGIINCLSNDSPLSFAGFTTINVVGKDMEALGLYEGSDVSVKSINAKTLKEGDIIAFYQYATISNTFELERIEDVKLETKNIVGPKYQISFLEFFGTQGKTMEQARKNGCKIVFRKIYEVYDVDGVRWFATWNSTFQDEEKTNPAIDDEYVREDLVLGVYDNSGIANFISGSLQLYSRKQGIILAFILPLILMGSIILFQYLCDAQMLKLQLDVIEEKRKITDPICIKYKVGFQMTNKMKYKVLAQANDDEKYEYISLLWEEGNAPINIRKYCLRKKMYLKPVEKLLEINRICQEKLNNGEDPDLVAKYYLEQKEALQKQQLIFERKFRKWVREDKIDWVSDEELEYDDEEDKLNINEKKNTNEPKQNVEEDSTTKKTDVINNLDNVLKAKTAKKTTRASKKIETKSKATKRASTTSKSTKKATKDTKSKVATKKEKKA